MDSMIVQIFSAGVSERPSPRCSPTLTVARFALARCASILWVIMSSLASSTQVVFAVTTISWIWWHPCRVTPRSVLCVSITRCRRRVMALASRVSSEDPICCSHTEPTSIITCKESRMPGSTSIEYKSRTSSSPHNTVRARGIS